VALPESITGANQYLNVMSQTQEFHATNTELIKLRIPPWNTAIYMQAMATALDTPQHRAIRLKYGAVCLALIFASNFPIVWLLRKYAMPINLQAILICVFWGVGIADIFRHLQGRARMQSMMKMHAEFMDGYEIHINPASDLIAFVTPFYQMFVEKRHIRYIRKIGENFIFIPQSTMMFYHLPQSILVASGCEARIRRFFSGELPA